MQSRPRSLEVRKAREEMLSLLSDFLLVANNLAESNILYLIIQCCWLEKIIYSLTGVYWC